MKHIRFIKRKATTFTRIDIWVGKYRIYAHFISSAMGWFSLFNRGLEYRDKSLGRFMGDSGRIKEHFRIGKYLMMYSSKPKAIKHANYFL